MAETRLTAPALNPWELEATGPATLAQVMEEEELRVASGQVNHLLPLPTGYDLGRRTQWRDANR